MKKIITLLIMVAVAASCFTGCEGKITSSGEINITGNGEKSSSVEELSSAEDESASTGGSTSDQEITLESLGRKPSLQPFLAVRHRCLHRRLPGRLRRLHLYH